MLFPWPGFFEQLMLADVYLFLDDTQFSKGSFTNRIQIKHQEKSKWMSIPLEGKGSFQTIAQLIASGDGWRAAHQDLLKQAFADAPYSATALDLVRSVYRRERLCDLLIASIEQSAKYLGIGQGQRRSLTSTMKVEGRSWRRVLDLVRSCGGTRYITGHGAAAYLDHEAFEAEGVSVEYMRYSLTPWPQLGQDFAPYVSVLDLIANVGPGRGCYLKPQTVSWRQLLQERQTCVER